ncbi:MAG: hypothetical protein IAE78_20340 [Myxococcus sp.]|nr:hypothetical protein [Myxococcus sp.]
MRDDREFVGTPVQIVRAMKDIAFGVEHLNLAQYIEWVVANAKKFEEVELEVSGKTDDELSAALVDEMVRTGLTRRA